MKTKLKDIKENIDIIGPILIAIIAILILI
jgi:hypothetical protein